MNELEKKRDGGNVVLNIDIKRAYDTLEWLLLERFFVVAGLNATVIRWIMKMLESTRISVLVNG